jgi:hypothetical protein
MSRFGVCYYPHRTQEYGGNEMSCHVGDWEGHGVQKITNIVSNSTGDNEERYLGD